MYFYALQQSKAQSFEYACVLHGQQNLRPMGEPTCRLPCLCSRLWCCLHAWVSSFTLRALFTRLATSLIRSVETVVCLEAWTFGPRIEHCAGNLRPSSQKIALTDKDHTILDLQAGLQHHWHIEVLCRDYTTSDQWNLNSAHSGNRQWQKFQLFWRLDVCGPWTSLQMNWGLSFQLQPPHNLYVWECRSLAEGSPSNYAMMIQRAIATQ